MINSYFSGKNEIKGESSTLLLSFNLQIKSKKIQDHRVLSELKLNPPYNLGYSFVQGTHWHGTIALKNFLTIVPYKYFHCYHTSITLSPLCYLGSLLR